MNSICLEDNINKLGIDNEVLKILNQNNVLIIDELWKLKRNNLKKMGLNNMDIQHIKIKLQLRGLDLNKRIYKKN